MEEANNQRILSSLSNSKQNPDTVALFKAVGDYRRQFGYEETIRKLELMTEWTKELYVQEYDRALREQTIEGCELTGAIH